MRFFLKRRKVIVGVWAGFFTAMLLLFPFLSDAEELDGFDDNQWYIPIIVKNMQQHEVTISNVIFAAEAAGNGIAIGFTFADNGIEVTLIRDGEILRVDCSPVTGDVITVGTLKFLHSILAQITNRYNSLKAVKVSLREAIAIAENSENGFAYKAHVEYYDSWANYEIQMVVNNKLLQIIIDPENGRIVGRRRGRFDEH
ncbi:MAG: PepSY domain-containing protein [Halodesulfovibrio sp.]|uniref:PepSY domain-containing protein n=1 Tax=Halodesulfovibrio sp. TaxID=1912772 RepID=UPI00359E35C8